ncbi:pirin family protein [Candidatus Thiodiazotropha endoloripes]|uniref:Quercetin 2,3-dioxygenase n=1 Tax=Candidatus Thiodiazotropha endoloripes TaxID=1818881 RepID=A0A1E2UL71_9GAMM|nr:pirin family protein [Candidatus Thiodiazotropha endoloripes]ODB95449.1 quercetin 2,3-dioxygenase [Candidatus Thiodiazotropha endoloripes]
MSEVLNKTRSVQQILTGQETADGAGVRLTRLIGGPQLMQLDPFLLLDDFRSDDPDDYIGGFPPHPHRGFETVTYLMAGKLEHRDNAGHTGILQTGGVQWMTAGRGVIHSEMPQQQDGLLAGFQLWVNLPARDKMTEPRYQEFDQQEIPLEQRSDGVEIRVIAGETSQHTRGPVRDLKTPARFFDITLEEGAQFIEPIEAHYNAFVYLLSGAVEIGGQSLSGRRLAVLDQAPGIEVTAQQPSRMILVAGEPLGEPIARGGPFVMNTEDEIKQAFSDYQEGRF